LIGSGARQARPAADRAYPSLVESERALAARGVESGDAHNRAIGINPAGASVHADGDDAVRLGKKELGFTRFAPHLEHGQSQPARAVASDLKLAWRRSSAQPAELVLSGRH
jgi:hypothetical protein